MSRGVVIRLACTVIAMASLGVWLPTHPTWRFEREGPTGVLVSRPPATVQFQRIDRVIAGRDPSIGLPYQRPGSTEMIICGVPQVDWGLLYNCLFLIGLVGGVSAVVAHILERRRQAA